jgi:GTP:adenosylcobinamide-phosphate guanylyltransferase
VLVAGDRGAARAVAGRSKPFIEVCGRPMVVHVLETLLHTPEVSEVYVVGDAIRLEKAIAEHGMLRLASARSRPIHIVPQRRNLYENVWHAFLRTLPSEGPVEDHAIAVVPADVPLMIPEELSAFLQRAQDSGADYAIGLSPEMALLPYAPQPGKAGIEMACFNLAEGRFRQNNLHYVRPLRMGNRPYIQDVYETRYQKEFGNMLRLGWRILRREYRNLWVVFFYLLMHIAALLDRRGHRRAADRVRKWVPLATVERGVGCLLRTRVRFVFTSYGGAALDIDNDADFDAAEKMLPAWKEMQARYGRGV